MVLKQSNFGENVQKSHRTSHFSTKSSPKGLNFRLNGRAAICQILSGQWACGPFWPYFTKSYLVALKAMAQWPKNKATKVAGLLFARNPIWPMGLRPIGPSPRPVAVKAHGKKQGLLPGFRNELLRSSNFVTKSRK